VELSLEARPVGGLTLASWVAWNEAVLTQRFPAGSTAYGVPGYRLPDGSRWSGNFAVDEDFPIWRAVTGFVGSSVTYVGDRFGPFRGLSAGVPLPRQRFPSYTQVDLRSGIKTDTWTLSLTATNVTDRRNAIYGGLGALPPTAFTYILPRTISLSVSKAF
jgi:hypothetical protein